MARFKLNTHEPDTGNAAAIAITVVSLSRTRAPVDWTGVLLWKISAVNVSLLGGIRLEEDYGARPWRSSRTHCHPYLLPKGVGTIGVRHRS